LEDQTDADNTAALSDIRNTIHTTAANSNSQQQKVTPTPPPVDKDVPRSPSPQDKENTPASAPVTAEKARSVAEAASASPSSTVKNGNYFINEMSKVKVTILGMSEKAAVELDSIEESSDRAGCIHAAIGKGNLLVKKKFKQFEELCQANLRGATADEPETTDEDLAGFWDMVMIQVEQIYSLFADLEKTDQSEEVPRTPSGRLSSPKKASSSTAKTTRPSVGAAPKVNSAAAKARDEARRKMIAEKRRAMKNQMQETQEAAPVDNGQEAEVQIFAPETSHTG